jgi:hypothetical protein
VLLLAGVGAVSAANLVQNGGFEDPLVTVGEFTPNMASGLTNWNIETGDIDLIGTHWKAYEKSQSIDLRGCSRATISQQILNTDPKLTYQLSFAMSGNPYSGDTSSKIRTVEVYWDNDPARTYSFDTSLITSQTSDMKWKIITIPNLQATSAATTIKFKDVSPNSNECVGVALDDIIVDTFTPPPVPEFPSIALPAALIVGMLGAVLFIQKSKEE